MQESTIRPHDLREDIRKNPITCRISGTHQITSAIHQAMSENRLMPSSSGLCAGELWLSAITKAGRDAGSTLFRQSLVAELDTLR